MNTYVHIEGLSKSFGKHQIFHNLACYSNKSETVAITGPSGCGKSTLLNILGLLETADEGIIELDRKLYPKK